MTKKQKRWELDFKQHIAWHERIQSNVELTVLGALIFAFDAMLFNTISPCSCTPEVCQYLIGLVLFILVAIALVSGLFSGLFFVDLLKLLLVGPPFYER